MLLLLIAIVKSLIYSIFILTSSCDRAGKNYKTIKDLMACSTSSSPVRERASLSFSAMKSLVLREKEEKFASEFSADVKALSLINLLVDAGSFITQELVNPCFLVRVFIISCCIAL